MIQNPIGELIAWLGQMYRTHNITGKRLLGIIAIWGVITITLFCFFTHRSTHEWMTEHDKNIWKLTLALFGGAISFLMFSFGTYVLFISQECFDPEPSEQKTQR